MKEKFSIISALVVSSIVLVSLNQVYGQENQVIVTIMKGSADAGSGENKYGNHTGYGFAAWVNDWKGDDR